MPTMSPDAYSDDDIRAYRGGQEENEEGGPFGHQLTTRTGAIGILTMTALTHYNNPYSSTYYDEVYFINTPVLPPPHPFAVDS